MRAQSKFVERLNLPPISVVIPNWNGASLLKRYLPGVIDELQKYNPRSECIIVDDASTDDSVSLLEKVFPSVQVIRRKRNRGFSSAINAGIRAAQNEHVLLLNSDVAVTPNCFRELQTVFDQGCDTFAVAALQKQEMPDGRVMLDGFNTARWRHGHLDLVNATEKSLRHEQSLLAYCTAGCSLFSRKKLLGLGGFCEIFDPFYYEDAELGIQAAKRGWALRFNPNSVVYHHPGSTSRRKTWTFRFLPVRNYFILHWLTLDDPKLWAEHILHVTFRLLSWTLQGRIRYAAGFSLALLRLPQVVLCRRQRSRGWQYKLKDILRIQ